MPNDCKHQLWDPRGPITQAIVERLTKSEELADVPRLTLEIVVDKTIKRLTEMVRDDASVGDLNRGLRFCAKCERYAPLEETYSIEGGAVCWEHFAEVLFQQWLKTGLVKWGWEGQRQPDHGPRQPDHMQVDHPTDERVVTHLRKLVDEHAEKESKERFEREMGWLREFYAEGGRP